MPEPRAPPSVSIEVNTICGIDLGSENSKKQREIQTGKTEEQSIIDMKNVPWGPALGVVKKIKPKLSANETSSLTRQPQTVTVRVVLF